MSRSSLPTARAFARTHRVTTGSSASGTRASRGPGSRSSISSSSGSSVSATFATSASPLRRSRSSSVASTSTSHSTATGWWNVPTRFLPSGRFTAVLPPIAASTWAVSVVGTCTNGMPRMYVDATKPATSPVDPPPSAITGSARWASCVASWCRSVP